METAVIYAYKNRATGQQAVDSQIGECRKFAERNSMEVVEVYSDLCTRSNRNKLLRESKKGKFSTVIVSSIDRIDRAHERFFRIVTALQKNGVRVYCANSGNFIDVSLYLEYCTYLSTRRA